MKRLTILITMLMATSSWAYNETDLMKLKSINSCEGCDLSGVDFRPDQMYRSFKSVNLKGANLTNTNFSKTDLREANLREANLTGANLSGANLALAKLNGANLTKSNFTEADLSVAKLRGANLTGANFFLAKLFFGAEKILEWVGVELILVEPTFL